MFWNFSKLNSKVHVNNKKYQSGLKSLLNFRLSLWCPACKVALNERKQQKQNETLLRGYFHSLIIWIDFLFSFRFLHTPH